MLHRLKFAHYFKAPPLIGLDISAEEIRILVLQKTPEGLRIEKCIHQTIVNPAQEERGGLPWSRVKKQLSQLVAAAQLSGYGTAFALPSSMVIRKQIQLPAYVKEEKFMDEIQRRLLEYLPGLPEKELYFDYKHCETRDDWHHFWLVATRQSQLQPYVEAVSQAGLKIKIVDIDLYARTRAGARYLACLPEKPESALGCLDLQESQTTLIVFQEGEAFFHQVWPLNAADPLLLQELQKAWQFCANLKPARQVGLVAVAGAFTGMEKFLEKMKEHSSIPMQRLDPLLGMSYASSLEAESLASVSSRFLLCCGLALRVSSQ